MSDPERNRTSDLRFRKPEATDSPTVAPSEAARNGSLSPALPHNLSTTAFASELDRLRAVSCEVSPSAVYRIAGGGR